ncbi:regulator of ribonuclease activity A [Mariprofundus micogutta]|uniref:4-hydroxy-4-methyl-2-oxoglutarate aldolase n=1 Tax=Mariprofundus micogutta TaxID=1921010 RepID=A0A1L8CND5_9PROT|nr:ribonuclease E activity regulator RraA [Mariprofundus micogutta]GAV20426.1 regulator of ribonuclease activity A [Mariprofundus micogutta]
MFKTTDLYDDYLEALQVAAPVFRDFGGRQSFSGQIVTLKALEDNTFLKAAFETDGRGKVLVVDSAASMRCAMMGDVMASLGASNGWEGVIINGCIRDSADVAKVDLGVKALATIPRKTTKRNQGVMDIPLRFADVVFNPGEYVYADEDGIVLSEKPVVRSKDILKNCVLHSFSVPIALVEKSIMSKSQ